MNKRGKIYTYTVIRNATEAFRNKVPYVMAIIMDDENKKTMAHLEQYNESDQISIGREVEFLSAGNDAVAVFRLI